MSTFTTAVFVLANVASAYAQGPPSYGDPDSAPSGPSAAEQYYNKHADDLTTAHAVIATITFGLFFPVGAILISLGSSPKLWLVHGLFQTAAYACFIAAAGLGIFIAKYSDQLKEAHPIIGMVLLAVIFFLPFFGYLHHVLYVKRGGRTAVSHAHIWVGRAVITLGIINGGLGLQLSGATTGQIVGYSVVAGLIWLVYVASAFIGESRRSKTVSDKKAHIGANQDMREGPA